jgi:integrase
LSDLYLVRLHSDKCPHRFLNCKCAIGVDGQLKGKRYRRSLETRNLDKAYRKLAELERPDYKEPKPIKDAIDAFKASKEDVGHGTKRNQRRARDNFLEITKAAGITKLDDVEIETIDLFRAKRPISATTWTKELAILRNFFSFCVNRKWISFNPAKEVKPPKTKPKPKEPYTQDEVIQILRRVMNSAMDPTSATEREQWFCYFGTPACASATLQRCLGIAFATAAFTCTR